MGRTVIYKVVRLEEAGQEVLARAGNFIVARAAFDTSVSLANVQIELRQGARVIHKSGRMIADCGQSQWFPWRPDLSRNYPPQWLCGAEYIIPLIGGI